MAGFLGALSALQGQDQTPNAPPMPAIPPGQGPDVGNPNPPMPTTNGQGGPAYEQQIDNDLSGAKSGPGGGNMWQRLLGGILTGMAGGMAVDPRHPERAPAAGMAAVQNQNAIANQRQQQMRENANSDQRLEMDTQSHQFQMAHLQALTAQINHQLQMAPQSRQQAFEDNLRSNVLMPLYESHPEMLYAEGAEEGGDMYSLRDEAMRLNQHEHTMDYIVGPSVTNSDGYAIYKMPHDRLQEDKTVDFGNGIKVPFPKGTPLTAYAQAEMTAAGKRLTAETQEDRTLANNRVKQSIANLVHSDRQAALALASNRPEDQSVRDQYHDSMRDLEIERAGEERNAYIGYEGGKEAFDKYYEGKKQQITDTLKANVRQPLTQKNNQSKQLSPAEALQYLNKAGGDKDKARQLAKADGRTF